MSSMVVSGSPEGKDYKWYILPIGIYSHMGIFQCHGHFQGTRPERSFFVDFFCQWQASSNVKVTSAL